jgi:manganese/iron transport system substrate-binding protein
MLSRFLKTTSITAVAAIFATGAYADDKMKVVTTFTVLADMAANVAGDAADVVSITKPGAEIHGYEPTPQDIVRASGADLILWNGMNLELWFEQFLSNMKDVPSVTLTDGIDPIPITTGSYKGKPNPHAWMGLDNALIYIDNIVEAFTEHDPENAAIYVKNAGAYKDKLRATIDPLRAAIASIPEDRR